MSATVARARQAVMRDENIKDRRYVAVAIRWQIRALLDRERYITRERLKAARPARSGADARYVSAISTLRSIHILMRHTFSLRMPRVVCLPRRTARHTRVPPYARDMMRRAFMPRQRAFARARGALRAREMR